VAINAKGLAATGLLVSIVMYFLSILGYRFFYGKYAFPDGASNECLGIMNCFAIHLDYGLRTVPEWLKRYGIWSVFRMDV